MTPNGLTERKSIDLLPRHFDAYMAGSSQPQHFFAAGCIFADFAITVIFYPAKLS